MQKYLMFFFLIWSSSLLGISAQKEAQIHQIDAQIEELQDMKLGFEARALRHEDQADRLQFNDETYLETRRHIQLAEENRAKAAAVQKEIDRLQAEKEKLLRQSHIP
jgi:hypothetical protein